MIKKLLLLRNLIDLEESFRFRACSILLIYESCYNGNINCSTNMDIRIIDFSHTTSKEFDHHPCRQCNEELNLNPNKEFVAALDNLLSIFSGFSASA